MTWEPWEPSEPRALGYFRSNEQFVEDPDKYDQMLRAFSLSETRAELDTYSMMFILDMSYPRQDIAAAIGVMLREKGWHWEMRK